MVKSIGKPDALKAPVRFDVAGTENVPMAVGMRPRAKAMEVPPKPKGNASVLDPTAHQAFAAYCFVHYSG